MKDNYQEALAYIKHDLENNDFIRYKNGNHVDKYHREILIKLVDKGTPMVPKNREIENLVENGYIPLVVGECGKCDCEIHEPHKYCWNCGQKIDWSDEDVKD